MYQLLSTGQNTRTFFPIIQFAQNLVIDIQTAKRQLAETVCTFDETITSNLLGEALPSIGTSSTKGNTLLSQDLPRTLPWVHSALSIDIIAC
jgi:hypothetical protein